MTLPGVAREWPNICEWKLPWVQYSQITPLDGWDSHRNGSQRSLYSFLSDCAVTCWQKELKRPTSIIVGELSSRKVGFDNHKKNMKWKVRQLSTENTKLGKDKIVWHYNACSWLTTPFTWFETFLEGISHPSGCVDTTSASFFWNRRHIHAMYCIIMFLGLEISTQEWQE